MVWKRAAVAGPLALLFIACGATPRPIHAPAPAAMPAVATGPGVTTAPVAPRHGRLVLEHTLAAGKWPGGVVVLGDDAWVTLTDGQAVERVALDGSGTPTLVPVGRTPVEIVADGDRAIYPLARTDRTLWKIDPATATGRVAERLPDCAQGMTLGAGFVWVLLWNHCTGGETSVLRVDLAHRALLRSPETGRNAWGVAFADNHAWVAADGGLISVGGRYLQHVDHFDTDSTSPVARVIVTGPHGVYATAVHDVVRVDPGQGQTTSRVTLPEHVFALSPDDRDVIAIGEKDTVWRLDPISLEVKQRLSPPAGMATADPIAVARWGDKLLVLDDGPDGAHGRLLVLTQAAARSS